MNPPFLPQLVRRYASPTLVKYLLIGGSAFAGEFLSFALLFQFIHLSVVPANVLSYGVGFVISFAGQRQWTFRSSGHRYHHRASRQLTMFTLLAGCNVVISTLLIQLLHAHIGLPALVAKVCVMVLIVMWNFLIFQRLIFRHRQVDKAS